MPKTKKTDLQVLRALMGLPAGKLSGNEKTVFRRMFEDVNGGMVIGLSKKQRMWAESVYDKHDLDNPKNRAPEAPPAPVAPKPKTSFVSSPKAQAQIEAFRRRRIELGLPDPIPEAELPRLISTITEETMVAIDAKAKERGMASEDLAVAYIRKLL